MNRTMQAVSFASAALLFAGLAAGAEKTTVHFRLMDTAAGQTTPAMVCITGTSDGEVRLPPEGTVSTQPSRVEVFVRGVEFDADRNWIGPVRKTNGKSDNDDRAWVYEMRPSLPYWSEPVMYQTSGDFDISLPAGKWRVAVAHGMEYIPVVEEFTLTGEEHKLTKTIELNRWVNLAERGWWSGDVHVHHPSLKPKHREYLLQYAMAEDLHVVNLLEMGHHKGTEFKQDGFGSKFRSNRGDYWLVPGQEEPRSTFGHILGLNISEFVRVEDVPTQYDFYDLNFKRIKKQPGGIVGFAHFAWNGCDLPRGLPWFVTTGDLDFVEILQFSLLNAIDYYDYLNLGFRLTAAAGSDLPWGSTMGEVRTYVYVGPKLDIDSWYAGLKAGNTFVTNGPALEFTVDGRLPGSEIKKQSGEKVRIAAKAWGHPKVGLPKVLSLVDNDGVIKEVINDDKGTEIGIEVEVPVERSRWIVAGTICDNNALAHTTPVYVIINGEPTWCPKRGPIVIDRMLKSMNVIDAEFVADNTPRGKGVRERLAKARAFYDDLRRKMNKQE
ncbi:MAG: CehA/McbA family metallohydrolase [Phycisphaerae bacterium]